MELIFIFMSITQNKYKFMKMGVNIYYLELMFILLNISQSLKLMKKVILTETFFQEKRQKSLEKKLDCKFIRINASKEAYDVDHEASRMQAFISKFKGRQLKNLNKILKELDGKIEKLTGQTNQ